MKSYKRDNFKMSVYELLRLKNDNRLVLDYDTRLEYNLENSQGTWDDKKKSYFIESVLLNITIMPVISFQNSIGVHEIVDGRQRLSTLFSFLNNEFTLKYLTVLTDLNGKSMDAIEPQLQSKLEDAIVTVNSYECVDLRKTNLIYYTDI